MKYGFSILCLLFMLVACSSPDNTPPSIEGEASELLGMWLMESVIQDTVDVTDDHNPASNRWLAINQDGSFESGGTPYGYNSGKWSYNVEGKELYLDSDTGEGDDSYWIVSLSDSTMEWKGTRSEFTAQFTITHKKKGF